MSAAKDGRSISLWDEETDELFDMIKASPGPGGQASSKSASPAGLLLANALRSESLFPVSPASDSVAAARVFSTGGPSAVVEQLRFGDEANFDFELDDGDAAKVWPDSVATSGKISTAAADLKVTTSSTSTPTPTPSDADELPPVLQPTSSLLTPFVFSFDEVFCGGDWYTRLRRRALAGELGTTQFAYRAIAWRLFLGVLDRGQLPAHWLEQAQQQRAAYSELLAKHYVVDPQAHSDDDPLSQNESSAWNKYFQNSQLEITINTDIPRTYPENDFFQSTAVQKQMLRPLFLWSVLNPRTSYRQGMHEILAPIIYLLHRHSVESAEPSDVAGQLSLRKFVEHDAYWMFAAVMEHAAPWFNNQSVSTPSVPAELLASGATVAQPAELSVVAKCRYIQETLLKRFDPQLATFLHDLEIAPHLYGIRWVRILLGREFHLEDILTVWDALFSYDGNLGLLDFICVAMLMFIRSNLLQLDYNGAMKRLFKFPPVENVTIFIERAIELREGKFQAAQAPPPSEPIVIASSPDANEYVEPAAARPSADAAPPPPAAASGKTGAGKRILQFVSGGKAAAAAAAAHQQPASGPSQADADMAARLAKLESEVDTLRTTQRHMASRLERIAFVLQQELFHKPKEDMEMDLLVLALAELKQVKDIGYGEIIVAQALDMFQNSVQFPAAKSPAKAD